MPEEKRKVAKILNCVAAVIVILFILGSIYYMIVALESNADATERVEMSNEERADTYGDKWGPAFVTVEEGNGYDIIYLRRTKAMYVVNDAGPAHFTELLDENHKPVVYKGE